MHPWSLPRASWARWRCPRLRASRASCSGTCPCRACLCWCLGNGTKCKHEHDTANNTLRSPTGPSAQGRCPATHRQEYSQGGNQTVKSAAGAWVSVSERGGAVCWAGAAVALCWARGASSVFLMARLRSKYWLGDSIRPVVCSGSCRASVPHNQTNKQQHALCTASNYTPRARPYCMLDTR
jgi:hypothetical protein